MAEAAEVADSPESSRYYCHKCNAEIEPLRPEYICGRCNTGFIELRESVPSRNIPPEIPSDAPENLLPQSFLNRIFTGFIDGSGYSFGSGDFVMQFHGGEPSWGSNGLYTVITHLLNQLDGPRPILLSQKDIKAIPEVEISAEQVTVNLQCSVCMEEFTLGEVTRRLECGHQFHSPCILPWLENHVTCPICRLKLTGNPLRGTIADARDIPYNGGASQENSPATSSSTPSTSGAFQRSRIYQEDDCD